MKNPFNYELSNEVNNVYTYMFLKDDQISVTERLFKY